MTTLPTPETLRSRAAVALACADSATDAGRHSTDAARILTETQRAAALAAYARELLTIADAQTPAPTTAPPAEVAPLDDHEPQRGDVYEYAGAHYAVSGIVGVVTLSLVGESESRSWSASANFVRRFCRRVSPAREAPVAERPAVYTFADSGREWRVAHTEANGDVQLRAADDPSDHWCVSGDYLAANFTRVPS